MKRKIYIARTTLALMLLPLVSACQILRPSSYADSGSEAAAAATTTTAAARDCEAGAYC